MRVSRDRVRHIAALAELHLDEATAAELEVQITRILDYVERIGELPPEGDDADHRAVRLRRDVPGADALATPPASFAPAFRDGFFTMPTLGEPDRDDDAP